MSETKGITVKVPIELHAEVSARLAETKQTMNEFVTQALEDELHPKNQIMEEKNMEKKKTIAFQVSEDLRDRWDAYLMRNKKTLVAAMTGLMEQELEREQAEIAENSHDNERGEEVDEDEEEEEKLDESGGDLDEEEETVEEEPQGDQIMGGM